MRFTEIIKNIKENSAPRLFTTQEELLIEHQQILRNGLCVPLTNLYAKSKIAGEKTDFLDDRRHAYIAAVEEENHQLELAKEGKDADHSAFVDLKVAHQDVQVDEKELTDNFPQTFAQTRHALITYPTNRGDWHMVYFGREKDHCSFFDANKLGGEIKGPCPNLMAYVSLSIKKDYSKDENEKKATVGRVYINPRF